MPGLTEYEKQRAENIKRNQALIRDLGIQRQQNSATRTSRDRPPPPKKRRIDIQPTRVSARLAASDVKISYNEDSLSKSESASANRISRTSGKRVVKLPPTPPPSTSRLPPADIDSIRAGWTSWKPIAPAPVRDNITGAFHFESHPDFKPNKSPEEVIREGCFGGSYFRPLYSRRLAITIVDDWKELPENWIDGLNVERFLTSADYDPEVNKFGVACGQSIEEWEANGWIAHDYDVRGWFQWYYRFFMGRRCDDDDRQVSRWKKCVGETGRWRRILLKKYVQMGVRTVWDDGEDEDEGKQVSPVVHQTCHHWAWEVRQGVLDEFWGGKR